MVGSGAHEIAGRVDARMAVWMPGFTQAIGELAEDPNRPISAAWAVSIQQSRLHNARFVDVLSRFHEIYPDTSPSETQRRFLSAEQEVIFAAQENGDWPFPPYPSEAYTDPKLWGYVWKFIQKDRKGYANRYFSNVRRSLGTTIPQRTVVMRFLNTVLPHLVGEEPTWANCGSGDMSPDRLNWLSEHTDEFAYDPVEVQDGSSGSLVTSVYKSDIFNGIVQEPSTIKSVTGIDRADPTLAENISWSHACSTPEEILSGRHDELHARLMRAHVPPEWLGFELADLSSRASVRDLVQRVGRFSGAAAFFSWMGGDAQQPGGSADQRRRKLHNIRKELIVQQESDGRDGVVLLADFARPVSGNRHLMPDWLWRRPTVFLGYRGILHVVLRGGNGRFRSVQVQPALVGLAKGGPYERQIRDLAGPV